MSRTRQRAAAVLSAGGKSSASRHFRGQLRGRGSSSRITGERVNNRIFYSFSLIFCNLFHITGLLSSVEKASPDKEAMFDDSLKNETMLTFCHEDLGKSHSVVLTKSAPAILERCSML